MGNMLTYTLGTKTGAFVHSGTTPLLSSVTESGSVRTVGYDAAGNETATGSSAFTYSPRNHLLNDGVYEYGYDGRGVRTVATRTGIPIGQGLPAEGAEGDRELQPSVLCASLGLESCLAVPAFTVRPLSTTPGYYKLYTPELTLLAETVTSTGAIKPIAYEYLWFGGQPVAQVDVVTGAIDWTFTDHLGTPILQTDANATVTWRVEYEPYGEVFAVRAGSGKHQPLRFPGQEFDANTLERAYNVFRWYRTGWGRYTQADPIGVVQMGLVPPPGSRQTPWNHLFGYVNASPIVAIDRLGLKPCASGECWDCPSGSWTVEETSSVAYLTWGFQWEGTTTFRCWGNKLVCSVYSKCQALGGGWTVGTGAGFGWIGGKKCKCSEDLTETASISGGAGPGYATWTVGPKCSGLTAGGSTSFTKFSIPSAYLAGVVCTSKAIGCSK